MFERFTEHARQVVVLAQDEARTLRHNHIGTEHLLLGLLREDGAAARALDEFDVTFETSFGLQLEAGDPFPSWWPAGCCSQSRSASAS